MPYTLMSLRSGPPLGFRFGVFFFAGGVAPNALDTRFKKVSGIGATVLTRTLNEGGQNLFSHTLPERVQYANLILERGLVVGSPLAIEFETVMSLFKFSPSNVMVTLLDEAGKPVSSWLFIKAYPVKWAVSSLDADSNTVVIETMELSYQHMQTMRL